MIGGGYRDDLPITSTLDVWKLRMNEGGSTYRKYSHAQSVGP